MTRILIADDSQPVRCGLRTLLGLNSDWQVRGEAVDGADAVEKAHELAPDRTFSPAEGVRYSLAGHLPILRRRHLEVELLGDQNLPIGVFSDTPFQSTRLEVCTGDVLAIITDGLTEVFNRRGEELGIEAISEVLRVTADRPLKEIAAKIFNRASQHGSHIDDQSLLLIRETG